MDALQMVATATAPDPYEPVIGLKLGCADVRNYAQYSAPYRRRAEILAATRRLLAEDGVERITIKSISDKCSISTQTVHNGFGCKTQLLRAAMNEHTLMIDAFCYRKTSEPEVFLLLALAYCQSAVSRPDFAREYMRAAFSSRQPLHDTLMKFGADLKLHILRDLGRRGLLRPFVDQRMAAEQIAYINSFAMQEWAEHDDIAQLCTRIVHGNGSLLLGILVPEAGRRIEEWLSGRLKPGALSAST